MGEPNSAAQPKRENDRGRIARIDVAEITIRLHPTSTYSGSSGGSTEDFTGMCEPLRPRHNVA